MDSLFSFLDNLPSSVSLWNCTCNALDFEVDPQASWRLIYQTLVNSSGATVYFISATVICFILSICTIAVSRYGFSEKWQGYTKRALQDISNQQVIVAIVLQTAMLTSSCTSDGQDAQRLWLMGISTMISQTLAYAVRCQQDGLGRNLRNTLGMLVVTSGTLITSILNASNSRSAVACSPILSESPSQSIGGVTSLISIAILLAVRFYITRVDRSRSQDTQYPREQSIVVLVCLTVFAAIGKHVQQKQQAVIDLDIKIVPTQSPWTASTVLPFFLLALPLYTLTRTVLRAIQDSRNLRLPDFQKTSMSPTFDAKPHFQPQRPAQLQRPAQPQRVASYSVQINPAPEEESLLASNFRRMSQTMLASGILVNPFQMSKRKHHVGSNSEV